jgi:hypothetical protein
MEIISYETDFLCKYCENFFFMLHIKPNSTKTTTITATNNLSYKVYTRPQQQRYILLIYLCLPLATINLNYLLIFFSLLLIPSFMVCHQSLNQKKKEKDCQKILQDR